MCLYIVQFLNYVNFGFWGARKPSEDTYWGVELFLTTKIP